MSGSTTQAAYYYQNHIAALKILDLLDFGSPITAVYLENFEKGPHIDDIIVVYHNFTRYYQVKWSKNSEKSFTISNLTQKEENGKSLLRQLAEGYNSPRVDKDHAEIILYSTRRASSRKGDAQHSLQDFLNNIHTPLITSPLLTRLSELPSFNNYKSIVEALKSASGLDEEAFDPFLRHLRFELNQDDLQRQRQKILTKLALLGIDERLYDTLLKAVVEWSISATAITKAEVLKELGLAQRLIDTVAHDYEVEENHYIENTLLFEQLDKAIAQLPGGFILVDGPPGSGKSTALTVYQRTRPQVKFAYYCFVPQEIGLGNRRMEKKTFLKSLCIGIRNAFPDRNFSQPYSEDYEDLLEKWLYELSTLGTKIVFIVDGVDYVDKRKLRLSSPLTNYLVGKLPDNIFFLLSSQYPEALSTEIQTQIRQNPLRHFTLQRFAEPKIDLFLHRWGVRLTSRERALVIEKTEGIPLYLNYTARLLLDTPHSDYEAALKELPIIHDETIDVYHEFLYEHISHNELTVWLLAILARRKEYTTTAILLELLTLLNVQSNAYQVQQSLQTFKHLLKIIDTDMYDIFHNSFREILLEKTHYLDQQINAALTNYYRNKLNSDESYRHFYRHLFELKQYDEILSHCNDQWLKQSWLDFRPLSEINTNIDIAWEAAIQLESFKEFIRIAFLKQQLAVIQNNLEAANGAHATFLLSIGKSEEATRKVWDGERVQCSLIEFSQFVLDYYKSTHDVLPERIIRSGFSKSKGQFEPQEASIYYQAQTLYFDWDKLFNEIGHTDWGTMKRQENSFQHSSKETSERINTSLKEKIIEVLFIAQKYDALLSIGQDQNIPVSLRNLALINAIDLCLRWDEVEEMLKLVKMVDFQELNRQHFAMLIVRLFEKGHLDKAQDLLLLNYLPMPLTAYRLNEEMNNDIDEQFTSLFKDLLAYFSLNPQGYSAYALQVGSLTHAERTFFGVTVELASLWCAHIRGAQNTKQTSRKVTAFLTDLHNSYENSEYAGDSSYRERNLALYRSIIGFATRFLSPPQIREVAEHWLQLEANSNRNLDISLDFAKCLFECNVSSLETVISQLLTASEAQARIDEETTALVANLISCAEAYGYCGLKLEAVRLWNELYMLACGIYYRKDYQFNEVIPVLHMTHKYYPEKSLQRLTKLLSLSHQLEDVARPRTLAQAITALIVFSCQLSVGLALELLHREDPWVHREETIKAVTRACIELPKSNLWHVWAIVKTMNKWDNLTYDDETYPTMRHILKMTLKSNDHNLALDIYTFSRNQFLVEKNTPWRIFEFANLCKQYGMVLGEVENDWQAFRMDWEHHQAVKSSQLPKLGAELPDLEVIKDAADGDVDKLLQLLAETFKQQTYLGSSVIEKYMAPLIKTSPFTHDRKYEQFCKQWFSGNELGQTLVAIARRMKKVDPAYTQALLIDAWKARQNFFYLYGAQATGEFFDIFFEVNVPRAKELLLESFYYQHQQYPREIINNLDQIIEYADYFEKPDVYEYLYDLFERYNIRLTEGLSEKEVDYAWVENYDHSLSFEQAIIHYLIQLFDYPQVEIRKLALRSLYQLILHDSTLISNITSTYSTQNENIKEHLLSLLFSVTIHQPDLLAEQKQLLLSFLNEQHFNIKAQIKEMLLYYAENGGQLEQHELDKLGSVNTYPHIVVPSLIEEGIQRGRNFIPTPYQVSLLEQLQDFQETRQDAVDKVYSRLLRYGWTTQSGLAVEQATRREHNINSNFDTIEINGPYFQAVQKALNQFFDQDIRVQEYSDEAIQAISPYFRLYDPTDVLVSNKKQPDTIHWVDANASDEEFLTFMDIENLLAHFVDPDKEMITLYEDGHQRCGAETQRTKKTSYFRIVAFLVATGNPLLLNAVEEHHLKPFIVVKNRYRFELPAVFQNGRAFPISGIRPIIGISKRTYREHNELSIASLLPDIIKQLGLTRESTYSLNYLKNNELALEFFPWQDAFDTERRRQKPTSAGVSLRIKREVLEAYLDAQRYELHFLLTIRRSIDKYVSEEEMTWRFHEFLY